MARLSAFLILTAAAHTQAEGIIIGKSNDTMTHPSLPSGGQCSQLFMQGMMACQDMEAACASSESSCFQSINEAMSVCSDDHVVWDPEESRWRNTKEEVSVARDNMELYCSDCGMAFLGFEEQCKGEDTSFCTGGSACGVLLEQMNDTCRDTSIHIDDERKRVSMRDIADQLTMMCSPCFAAIMGVENACRDGDPGNCDDGSTCQRQLALVRSTCDPDFMLPDEENPGGQAFSLVGNSVCGVPDGMSLWSTPQPIINKQFDQCRQLCLEDSECRGFTWACIRWEGCSWQGSSGHDGACTLFSYTPDHLAAQNVAGFGPDSHPDSVEAQCWAKNQGTSVSTFMASMDVMCSNCGQALMNIETACPNDDPTNCDENSSCQRVKEQMSLSCPEDDLIPGTELTSGALMDQMDMMCSGCFAGIQDYTTACSEDRATDLCEDGSRCSDLFWRMQTGCRGDGAHMIKACFEDDQSCECQASNATFCASPAGQRDCGHYCTSGWEHPACQGADYMSCECMWHKEEDFCARCETTGCNGCNADCGLKMFADLMFLGYIMCPLMNGGIGGGVGGGSGSCTAISRGSDVWDHDIFQHYKPIGCAP